VASAAAMAYSLPSIAERPGSGTQGEAERAALSPSAVFSYSPNQATLTIGQEAEFHPQLAALPTAFRLVGSLPQGLVFDPVSGVISGAPMSALAQTNVVVEVDLLGDRTAYAAVELEVVDFTRGGFVIGHMNEFEPGKFMLLLYVPEDSGENSESVKNAHPFSGEHGGVGVKGRGAGNRLTKRPDQKLTSHGSDRAARGVRTHQQQPGQLASRAGAEAGSEARKAQSQDPPPDWW